jgi:hypothetical protein
MQRWLLPVLALLCVVVVALGIVLLSTDDAPADGIAVVSPSPTGTTAVSPTAVSPTTMPVSPTATPPSPTASPRPSPSVTRTPTKTPKPSTTVSTNGTPRPSVTAEEVMLRLSDVPAGYMLGDDSDCGQVSQEGSDGPLLEYITGEWPRFCRRHMEYVCQTRPEDFPQSVTTGVLFLSSDEKASEGMDVLPNMATWLMSTLSTKERAEEVDIGNEAVAFDTKEPGGRSGVLIGWRNGSVLNFVEVVGAPATDALFQAEALAQAQNERFTNPKKPEPEDTDDTTVLLDCGDSDLPVYWPGKDFASDKLPDTHLIEARGPAQVDSGPKDTYRLEYATQASQTAFILSNWTSEQWNAYLATELGKYATDRPCGEPQVIQLEDRKIEIHRPISGCAERYVAHVLFSDAIVTINVPEGLCCIGPLEGTQAEFDIPSALETIARALEKR